MNNEWIKPHQNGLLLRVKAVPNSSRNQLSIQGDQLKIHTTAPALENRANQEIIKFIAKLLQVKKREIQIISGEKSREKLLYITEHPISEIQSKINEVIYESG